MANFFYYNNEGTKQGPVSREELQILANQCKINPQTRLETEGGHSGIAGQISGLFPSPNPFGSKANFNPQQAAQAVDKAYVATKTFAENSAWKTGLFRISQLLVVVFEVFFLLYGFSCLMSNPEDYQRTVERMMREESTPSLKTVEKIQASIMVAFFHTKTGIAALFSSLISAAMCVAVLETAISTGRMVDYLRKE